MVAVSGGSYKAYLDVIAGATFFALNRSGTATALAWTGLGFIVLIAVASIDPSMTGMR